MKSFLITTIAIFSFAASSSFANESEILKELQEMRKQIKSQQELIDKLESRLNQEMTKKSKAIEKIATKTQDSKQDVKITMSPSPKIETTDGKYSFEAFGRIHTDMAFFSDDKNDHPDGATFRRMRLGVEGTVDHDLSYKAELDFGNKDSNESVSFKEVYLEYTGSDAAKIKFGNFKPSYGLEELTSSNHITMIERSLPTGSFTTGEVIGLQAYNGGENYSWAIGAHNDESTTKSSDDEAKSLVGRLSYAPIAEKDQTLHFGISQAYRVPDSADDSVSFDNTAENSLQRLQSADTGNITDVESIHLTGLELAGVYGPLSLQGEYFYNSINRESSVDLDVNGWYAQASYFLTGESRPYRASSGVFGRINPINPFSIKEGGLGAWEIAARYSNLDLNDGAALQGGMIDTTTLGINWYLNNNTRLMANYIIVNTDDVDPSGPGADVDANDDPNIFLLRAAVDF